MLFVPFVAIMAALAAPAPAIINGSPDGGGHPQVGAMLDSRSFPDGTWSYCSGTLISPTVFLTAAHCGEASQKRAKVSFASRYHLGDTAYAGRYVADPKYRKASDLHDIAVVIFDSPVSGIRPARLPTAGALDGLRSDDSLRSAGFTTVGFGAREGKRSGKFAYNDTRYQANISYSSLTRNWLQLTPKLDEGDGSTCYGDSGGPNFLGGPASDLLVATSISSDDSACKATNVDYRLDTPTARRFLGKYVTLP
jgi:secreted trypsin-like serine protease